MKPNPLFLMLICTFLIAMGQILWKLGLLSSTPFWASIIIIAGFITYSIGALLMIIALKYGQLSVLHPIFSLSYIWVAAASPLIFISETMTLTKWAGIAVIFIGVSLVSYGGRR